MTNKSFTLNLGNILAKPYESVHNIVRRCLIANPGIPLSVINANIPIQYAAESNKAYHSRSSHWKYDLLSERINAIQVINERLQSKYSIFFESLYAQDKSYKRNCPQCASEVYHTNLFSLPWLTLCPLHHCPITEKCPICQQEWPDSSEMARRKCVGCGILGLTDLKKIMIADFNKNDYQVINEIYKQIYYVEHTHSIVRFKDNIEKQKGNRTVNTNPHWLWMAPIKSSYYLSLIAERKKIFSDQILKSFDIPNFNPRCKTTNLTITDKRKNRFDENLIPTSWWFEELVYTDDDFVNTQLRKLYGCMRYIVNWINNNTPRNHQICLISYRHQCTGDFVDASDPCPYCLAFSLWFFHTITKFYGPNTTTMINNYPFCRDEGLIYFYTSLNSALAVEREADASTIFYTPLDCDRNLNFINIYFGEYSTNIKNMYTIADDKFNNWLFNRGLEISFLAILRFVFHLISKLKEYRSGKSYVLRSEYDDVFSDQYYYSKIINGRLYFYYENEHPLLSYTPEIFPNLDVACQKSTSYHMNNISDSDFGVVRIPKTGLTYKSYIQIAEKHREYLFRILDRFVKINSTNYY